MSNVAARTLSIIGRVSCPLPDTSLRPASRPLFCCRTVDSERMTLALQARHDKPATSPEMMRKRLCVLASAAFFLRSSFCTSAIGPVIRQQMDFSPGTSRVLGSHRKICIGSICFVLIPVELFQDICRH